MTRRPRATSTSPRRPGFARAWRIGALRRRWFALGHRWSLLVAGTGLVLGLNRAAPIRTSAQFVTGTPEPGGAPGPAGHRAVPAGADSRAGHPAGPRLRRLQGRPGRPGPVAGPRRLRGSGLHGKGIRCVRWADPPGLGALRGGRRIPVDRLPAGPSRGGEAGRQAGGRGGRGVLRRRAGADARGHRPPDRRGRRRHHLAQPGHRAVPERRRQRAGGVQEALGRLPVLLRVRRPDRRWQRRIRAPAPTGPAGCGRFAPQLCQLYQAAAGGASVDAGLASLLADSSPSSVLDQMRAPVLLSQGEQDSLFGLGEADANARQLVASRCPGAAALAGRRPRRAQLR